MSQPASGATMVQVLRTLPSYSVRVVRGRPRPGSTLRALLIAATLQIFRIYEPGGHVARPLTETASEHLIFAGEATWDLLEWPDVVRVVPQRHTLWFSADDPVPLLGARHPFVSRSTIQLQED